MWIVVWCFVWKIVREILYVDCSVVFCVEDREENTVCGRVKEG